MHYKENGEILFISRMGKFLTINQYGYSYIIPDQSTDAS